ncbi:unnamed protein product [Symbiodinium microadriaticum]|nr:unnamed protein product [Symbiodinium sp. KB8]CAE7500844.1 unnamed protein product [Symbiodinium microadriaticum]
MTFLRCGGLLSLFFQAAAWPGSLSCDFSCMGGYTPGSSFGYMGIANVGATSGDTCKIATDVPSGGYTAGESYMVTVTSTTSLGQKLVSNGGTFSNGMVSDAAAKTTSMQHAWTAPSSGDVTFRALCGAGGSVDEMWAAAEVMVSAMVLNTTTTTTDPNATTSSTTTVDTTTTTTTDGGTTSAAAILCGAPALILAAIFQLW